MDPTNDEGAEEPVLIILDDVNVFEALVELLEAIALVEDGGHSDNNTSCALSMSVKSFPEQFVATQADMASYDFFYYYSTS